MPVVSILGRERFYRIVGEGEPLLLISGLGADHTVWGYQVQAFRSHFRCIVFDNPGSGPNAREDEPLSIASMAEYTALLLDAVGVLSAHILGTSMGSAIAMELAISHPEMVRTLSLNAAWAGPELGLTQQLELLLSAAEAAKDEAVALQNVRRLLFLLSFTPDYFLTQPDKAFRSMQASQSSRQSLSGFVVQLKACLGHDVAGRLKDIKTPALITHGERDTLTPPEYGEELARAIPGSKFVVIRGSGHAAFMEKPEEFNRVHLEFLTARQSLLD